jgi:hypothetical protein
VVYPDCIHVQVSQVRGKPDRFLDSCVLERCGLTEGFEARSTVHVANVDGAVGIVQMKRDGGIENAEKSRDKNP